MDRLLLSRVSKILEIVFLVASLGLAIAACYLYYYAWLSISSADRVLVQPYESYLLYTQHYDWARAPFLQALQGASICIIFWGVSRMLPRMVDRWKAWVPRVIFFISMQIVIFNVVVNDMTAHNWLYNAYLAMSWFEPWLLVTLASVTDGFYSTGGVAFVALMLSAVALFAARRAKGLWAAFADVGIFLSISLFVFELGILEYRSMWWNLWVSQFQFTIGMQWLTNHTLYSVSMVCVPFFVCLRLVLRWSSSTSGARLLSRVKLRG